MDPIEVSEQEPRTPRRPASLRLFAAVAVIAFLTHALALSLTQHTGGVAVLLPGNAVLLGLILTRAASLQRGNGLSPASGVLTAALRGRTGRCQSDRQAGGRARPAACRCPHCGHERRECTRTCGV